MKNKNKDSVLAGGYQTIFLILKNWILKAGKWNLKLKTIALLTVILIVFILFSLLKKDKKEELLIYKTESSPFREYYTINGILEAENSVKIQAPVVRRYTFKLLKLIPEGTLVDKGSLIAEFDTSETSEKLDNTEIQLQNSMIELEELKQGQNIVMDSMTDKLKTAEDNLKVAELTLKAMEFSSELNRKRAELDVGKNIANIEQVKRDTESTKLKFQIEIRKNEIEINQIKYTLAQLKKDIRDFKVYAPSRGIILYPLSGKKGSRSKIQIGDTLYYGKVFAILPDLTKMMVHLKINEVEINRIALNQSVSIELDSYKKKTYSGYVKEISRVAEEDEYNELIKNFDCFINIRDTDVDHLKPGISAICNITISTLANAIAVPIEAVYRDKKDNPICFILIGRNIEIRPVVLGPRNENYIVIKEGLKQGEFVVLNNPFEDSSVYESYKINEYLKKQDEIEKTEKSPDKIGQPDGKRKIKDNMKK